MSDLINNFNFEYVFQKKLKHRWGDILSDNGTFEIINIFYLFNVNLFEENFIIIIITLNTSKTRQKLIKE